MSYRYWHFVFIFLCTWCLFSSVGIPDSFPQRENRGWWMGYAMFSDWRGVGPVDFATNYPLALHYSGHTPISLRPGCEDSLRAKLNRGDTITIGADYYALNMSSGYFPVEWLEEAQVRLSEGKVFRVRMWLDGAMLTMETE